MLAATLRMVAAAAAIALASLSPAQGASAEAPRIAGIALEPRTVTVGDRIELTVEVAHDDGVTVEGPGFGVAMGGLDLIEIASPATGTRDGRPLTTLGYTLAAFRPGRYTLPPLAIRWRAPDGTGELETPPQQLTVESVLAPGEIELRPLKPQLQIDDGAPTPAVPALVVALFAVLTAFGYLLVRRAMTMAPAIEAPFEVMTPRPAEERARAALDTLASERLGASDPVAHYARISAIIRAYLGERFGFAAPAMTRREMQRGMEAHGIERWPARLTANLLEQCDAVQFAGFRPADERIDADLTAAYEIVALTTPNEPETT